MNKGMAFSTFEKPCLFFISFVLMVIYVPGYAGASIPTGWLWLIFILPILTICYKPVIKLEHKIGFVFLAFVCASLIWTIRFNIGVFYLAQFLSFGIAFYIGSALKDLRPIIIGLTVGLLVNDIFAILQYSGSQTIFTYENTIAGMFVNKNIYCETSVVLLIAAIVFRLWWLIPITLPGIIMVHSRAGLAALVICGFTYLWSQSKRSALLFVGTACICLPLFYLWNNEFNFNSIIQRNELWMDTINGLTFFGNGVGSYETLYPKNAILIDTAIQRPKYAHNDILNLVFEFGIFTIIIVPFLWNILIIKCRENYVLYSIFIISMVTYPFHTPIEAFIWFIVAGYIISKYDTFKYIWIFRRLELPARIENKRR